VVLSVFHWMSAPRPGPLPDEVVDELLSAATVCFSCVCHSRNGGDSVPFATDTSLGHGGSCLGVRLRNHGFDTWSEQWKTLLAAQACEASSSTLPMPSDLRIVIVSLFEGIGGISQAFKLAGVRVAALIIVEPDAGCRKVVRSRFPVAVEYADVEYITERVIARWQQTFGECQIFWSARCPVQNLGMLHGPQ
jgi:hypothetical protein